jgi:methionyl-tRNA synthetase
MSNTDTSISSNGSDFLPLKPEITIDDFGKIDLRTGVILSAQKVPKADKLLQLEIDLGFEKRTILSGIAMHFSPEEVIGKQVIVVANLAPRKMRGIDSNGMILMAEDLTGKLHFAHAGNLASGGWKVS